MNPRFTAMKKKQDQRRENLKAGLRAMVERRLFTPADLWKAIGRPEGTSAKDDPRPSKPAVYRWFETGGIADEHIDALAAFTNSDPDQLRLTGEFRPRKPQSGERHSQTAFETYQRMTELPDGAQQAVLEIVNTMVELKNRYSPPRRNGEDIDPNEIVGIRPVYDPAKGDDD